VVQDLGARIKFVRKSKGFTLTRLSETSGLSTGFLSEIERGLAEPSMASLRKIRRALGVSLLALRDEEQPPDRLEEPLPLTGLESDSGARYITEARLVRAGERKKLAYPNQPGFYELLTPDLNRRLEVLLLTAQPGFCTGREQFSDPPGEKCLIILKGRMLFSVGPEEFDMGPGDSLYYPANSPVSWTVPGTDVMECLLIITPPGF
jgi:transcriptional regulator with XRE-family HTH domain